MTNLTVTQRVKNLETRFASIEAKIDLILASKNKPANKGKGSQTSSTRKTSKKSNTKLSSTKKVMKGKGKKSQPSFEERMNAWKEKRNAYEPSTKLINAIKRDRASVTLEKAKTYGFIGTKQDLVNLKNEICK